MRKRPGPRLPGEIEDLPRIDAEMEARRQGVLPTVDYWKCACTINEQLADGTKVRIDWVPKTKTLTLDHPVFGRQIVSCFDPADHAGETLIQASVSLAERFLIAPPPGVKPIGEVLDEMAGIPTIAEPTEAECKHEDAELTLERLREARVKETSLKEEEDVARNGHVEAIHDRLEAEREADKPITRDTLLTDLIEPVPPFDSPIRNALSDVGLHTVGDLLDRCQTDFARKAFDLASERPYNLLLAIPFVGQRAAYDIAAALDRAGLIVRDEPTPAPTPKRRRGRPKKGEATHE